MRSDLTGKRFLIVDDEPDIRDFLRWEFEDRGGFVLEADSPAQGYEVFQKERPDFSLLDVRMPGGTGLDLMIQCKALSPQSPIALMTGYTEVSPGRIYDRGACDLFVKPLKYELLFPRIDKELLPLEERYTVISLPEPIETWNFESSLQEMFEAGELKLGRGGFNVHCDKTVSFPVGSYVELVFGEVECLVKYCWTDKDPRLGLIHGFEWIHLSNEELIWLLEQVKTLKSAAYIPCSQGS